MGPSRLKSAIAAVQELPVPAIGRGMDHQIATLGCKAEPVQLLLHATQLGFEGPTSLLLSSCDDLQRLCLVGPSLMNAIDTIDDRYYRYHYYHPFQALRTWVNKPRAVCSMMITNVTNAEIRSRWMPHITST